MLELAKYILSYFTLPIDNAKISKKTKGITHYTITYYGIDKYVKSICAKVCTTIASNKDLNNKSLK